MPISSFYGLQTSLRGLLAQQRSLDVTGHNIANASTAGYSRQTADLAASGALTVPQGMVQGGAGAQLPTGVEVQTYRRVRDTFLDLQFRAQATRLGDATARSQSLDRAELALAEPSSTGINTQLSQFWSSWSALTNDPESAAARQAVVEQGNALANAFRTVDQQLSLVARSAREELDTLMQPGGEIEQTAKEIARLNDSIEALVTAGQQPNDLMDARDRALDHLAGYGQVSIESLAGGAVKVTFGGAGDPPLVDRGTVAFPPPLSSPGGRLGALQDVATVPGGVIDTLRGDLRAVVRSVADTVNAAHATGGTGDFFAYTAGDEASTLTVAVSPADVKATATGTAGGNEIARRISELRDGAADGAYRAFVSKLGTQAQSAASEQANARALTDSVEDRRQSVSGVSLDEEMTNLIRFQRGYQASSRAMSTMDEMLDVLINRTGRVGL